MIIQLGNPEALRDNRTLWMLQIFSHGVPAESHLLGNQPCRITRIFEPVDLEDRLSVNHRDASSRDCRIIRATIVESS